MNLSLKLKLEKLLRVVRAFLEDSSIIDVREVMLTEAEKQIFILNSYLYRLDELKSQNDNEADNKQINNAKSEVQKRWIEIQQLADPSVIPTIPNHEQLKEGLTHVTNHIFDAVLEEPFSALFEACAAVKLPTELQTKLDNALKNAIANNSIEQASCLLAVGANINAQDSNAYGRQLYHSPNSLAILVRHQHTILG